MAPATSTHDVADRLIYEVAGWCRDNGHTISDVVSAGKNPAPVYDIPFLIGLRRHVYVDGVLRGVEVAKKSATDAERKHVYVPVASLDGTARGAASARESLGEPLTARQMQSLIAWLADASRVAGIPGEYTISRATWQGETLLIPGVNAQPVPGAKTISPPKGDEVEAADAWRHIMTLAQRHPKLGVLIGAAVISPYLERLHVKGSTYQSEADSTKFKTKGNEVAMSVYDDPTSGESPVRDNWNTTPVALSKRLSALGCLPLLLDETGTATRFKEQLFHDAVFMVHDGHGRSRGTKDGGMVDDGTFTLNLLSTGEEPLIVDGATGGLARVHGLRFPLTNEPDEIAELDYAHARAIDFAGWPLRWIMKMPLPQCDDLEVPVFDSPLAQRHAEALAAARLGFRLLAQALDVDGSLSVEEVAADITEDVERGSAADRLREALWEDYVSRSYDYTAIGGTRGSRGIKRDDGHIAYFPKTVQEVATTVGVGVQTAMRDLRERGVLVAQDDGKHLTKLVRVDGKPTWMYVLADLHEVETTALPFSAADVNRA